jgi:hypothetical protein
MFVGPKGADEKTRHRSPKGAAQRSPGQPPGLTWSPKGAARQSPGQPPELTSSPKGAT